MYIREPLYDQLPKSISPGDVLFGTINYEKKSESLQGASNKPNGWPVKYIVADTKPVPPKSKPVEENKEEEGTMDYVIREAKIKLLKSKVGDKTFIELFQPVASEYPDNLAVKQVLLSHYVKCKTTLFSKGTDDEKLTVIEDVINSANGIVLMIDHIAVATELGVKEDKENPVSVTSRKDAETKKAALIDALSTKALVLIDKIRLKEAKAEDVDVIVSEFETTMKELLKWDDINNEKHWQLCVNKWKYKSRWGLALKRINELLTSSADNKGKDIVSRETLLEERIICLEKLGWNHFLTANKKLLTLVTKGSYDAF